MKTKLLLFAFFLFPMLIQAQNKETEWIKIGTKTVNFKPESDEISISKKNQDIGKVKLECTRGTAKLKEITVTYNDGSEETLKPKGAGILTKGTSSFSWSLNKEKMVKKLKFSYDAVGNVLISDRGRLEIWIKKRN